jgi:type VI secretion system Hcp family effector
MTTVGGLTITGHSTITANKDGIDVRSFAQAASAPRDSVSGNATGRRAYKAVEFTACQGPEYPLLAQCLDENQTIKEMHFQFYMSHESGKVGSGAGKVILSTEYKFTDCHIASLEMRLLNVDNKDLRDYEMGYAATFVFAKIEVGFKNNASTHFVGSWADQK